MKKSLRKILFYLCLLQITILTGSAIAETYWDHYTILAEDLNLSIDNSNLPDWIDYQISQPTLIQFTPLEYQEIDENHTLYRAEAEFSFQVTFTSIVLPQDLNIQTNEISENWGLYLFCTDFSRAQLTEWDGTTHDIQDEFGIYFYSHAREVDVEQPIITLSEKIANIDFTQFIFDDNLLINYDFSFDNSTLNFNTETIEFKNLAFTSRITSAQISESHSYPNVEYEDYFNEGIDNEGLRVIPSNGDEAQAEFSQTVQDLNLGVHAGSTYWETKVQGLNSPAPMGSSLLEIENQLQIQNIRLQPNILQKYQYYTVRTATMLIDTKSGFLSPAGIVYSEGPNTFTHHRSLGYKIENAGQSYTIRLKFEVDSLSEVNVIQTSEPDELSDINTTASDYYWGNYFEGQTGTGAVLGESQFHQLMREISEFLAQNWLIIIVVIVGIVAVIVYVYVRACLLYTSPSPRDLSTSRMPSSA